MVKDLHSKVGLSTKEQANKTEALLKKQRSEREGKKRAKTWAKHAASHRPRQHPLPRPSFRNRQRRSLPKLCRSFGLRRIRIKRIMRRRRAPPRRGYKRR